jgi:ABC-type Fe3+-siderophore transport system permease subunit
MAGVVSPAEQAEPLRYALLFIAAHLVASAMLAGLLLFVLARIGILGVPASHTLVLIGVAILTMWIFVRRHKRLPTRSEFKVLFVTCAVYLLAFDAVLSTVLTPAYPVEVRPYALAGHVFAALLDTLILYLALKFPARWIMRGRMEPSAKPVPNSVERP